MDLLSYQKYNQSFKKKFIYRLGGWTGFFSEYNNMILAMHYCAINHIQFVLESENANFSIKNGWNEFFLPFCKEISSKWLVRFNQRIKPTYKNKRERVCFNIYKRLHPNYLYMYSLFESIRKADVKTVYHVDELNLHGTLLQNCSELHRMIWQYNASTSELIDELVNSCNLPERYIGMHIRQGDKHTESKVYDPFEYMNVIVDCNSSHTVFVLTDDYDVLIKLNDKFPNYRFVSLCQESEHGYDYARLMKFLPKERVEAILRLWASLDIMERSELFVGTYSANPGMNMGFRMNPDKIKCLDFNEWQLW